MSDFNYLLSQPLPSKLHTEGVDCINSELNNGPVIDTSLNNPDYQPAPMEVPRVPDVEFPSVTPVSNPVSTELTPEEDRKVDDTMNAVATPIMIQSELTDKEIEEFVESVDSDIAINEGLLTERTIVKFDKNARKNQLMAVAVLAVAREKKDPLYKKLNTIYKMERIIEAKLRKKYYSQATRKVQEYLKRARQSKSGILARAAAKLSGIFKKK